MKVNNLKLKDSLIIVTYVFFLAIVIKHFEEVLSFVKLTYSTIKPFIIGFGMAFVLNILVKKYEEKIIPKFDKKSNKGRRGLAVILSILTVILIFTALLVFVLPQLIDSIKILFESIPTYMKQLEELIMPYINSTDILYNVWEGFLGAWREILQVATQIIGQSLSGIMNTTFSLTSSIVKVFVGFVVSIYMLLGKETLISNVKKVLFTITSKKNANRILKVAKTTNNTFSKFIAGQLIEAVIIGFLCFIGMLILNMPYPLLISVIIGATNIIPIFGPIFGTIPAAFILLMVEPKKAVFFVIFVIVLQQLESNLIYPRVVGSSIGLSAIWVLFAITIGGGLFGLTGMILGVPAIAVIYSLVRDKVNKELKEKDITIN